MRLNGIGAAPGFAAGPVWRHPPATAGGRANTAIGPVDPGTVSAVAAAQLTQIAERWRDAGRADEAAIFDAQALIAADHALAQAWQKRIELGEAPLDGLDAAVEAAAVGLASLDDETIAARAVDVRDVGARLARIVTGEDVAVPAQPSIVVAADLPPSTAAEIPAGLILGVAMESGSRTAHAAILARGLGIPCVVGVGGLLDAVDGLVGAVDRPTADGADRPEIALDGDAGIVVTRPTPAELESMRASRAAILRSRAVVRGHRERPAATRDGHRVRLLANIGSPGESDRALEMRAEGVGLFRTEYLFMGRDAPPPEAEQLEAYREVFAAFGPERPVVVRLADVGGDKDIPYLHLPREANPFLGVRAIRLAYRDRSLLVTQLRAISRAAAAAGVVPSVTAAMVATEADVRLLRGLVDEAQAGLASDGVAAASRIETGIMVEVPSAAFLTRELARLVDFFSIGTNDLTQYLLAADRTNPALADLQDALHPAVVRSIRMVTGAARAAGRRVAVCGELAGDPAGALVLVGLGADELSADAGSLDEIRYHLANVDFADLETLAAKALESHDAAAVRAHAATLLSPL